MRCHDGASREPHLPSAHRTKLFGPDVKVIVGHALQRPFEDAAKRSQLHGLVEVGVGNPSDGAALPPELPKLHDLHEVVNCCTGPARQSRALNDPGTRWT